MGLEITPIVGKLHWDSIGQKWEAKFSRQEKNLGKIEDWVGLLSTFATLSQAIAALLQYWAATGTSISRAAIGDLSELATLCTTMQATINEELPAPPAGGASFEGTTLDGTEYDGMTDPVYVTTPGYNWGQTPAPP